jgi:hypothetical protein
MSFERLSAWDLGRRCGTIAAMPRWLYALVVAAVIAIGAREARAQVFRPRTGKGAPVAKAAPPPAAVNGKKAPVADAAAAKAPRAAASTPKRTGPGKKRKAKAQSDSDDVKIDDDDEDVKITDD